MLAPVDNVIKVIITTVNFWRYALSCSQSLGSFWEVLAIFWSKSVSSEFV